MVSVTLIRRTVTVAYVVGLLLLGTVVYSEPALALKVSPNTGFGPLKVRFTVTIEPNKDNRKACLTYDGPEASESCWQVDGEKHQRTQWFERRVGGDGQYFAVLTLVSVVNGAVKHQIATTQFTVLEPGVPTVR